MQIMGSHKEEHISVRVREKASKVKVHAGLAQLKQQYNIDYNVLGSGAFGKVYKAVDKKNPEF